MRYVLEWPHRMSFLAPLVRFKLDSSFLLFFSWQLLMVDSSFHLWLTVFSLVFCRFASHFITRGGSGFLPRSTIFFFCPNESTIFFFFQNESTIFFLLPIHPLFYYMTEREWYYGFASAASASASAYDFWRIWKHNIKIKNYRVYCWPLALIMNDHILAKMRSKMATRY